MEIEVCPVEDGNAAIPAFCHHSAFLTVFSDNVLVPTDPFDLLELLDPEEAELPASSFCFSDLYEELR